MPQSVDRSGTRIGLKAEADGGGVVMLAIVHHMREALMISLESD